MAKIYDKGFPLGTVLIMNFFMVTTYAAGVWLFSLINIFLGALFLIFIIYIESSVYREGCKYCFYYGKRCAFGRGLLAPLFMKKGDPKKFCEHELTRKDFIPTMLPAFLPLVAAVYIIFTQGFSWVVTLLGAYPFIVSFLGNPIFYGRMACPHCKQGSICCPAMEFFMKREKAKK